MKPPIELRPPPYDPTNAQEYSAFYEAHVGINWHCLGGHVRMEWLRRFDLGPRVLEVGCGEGAFAYDAACRGSSVVAVDIAGGALAAFAQRLATAPYAVASRILLCRSRLEDLQWENEFSTVIAFEILEHVPDVPQALHVMQKALHYGGQLLVTTPRMADFDDNVDHCRRWTYESLSYALAPFFQSVFIVEDPQFLYARAT